MVYLGIILISKNVLTHLVNLSWNIAPVTDTEKVRQEQLEDPVWSPVVKQLRHEPPNLAIKSQVTIM